MSKGSGNNRSGGGKNSRTATYAKGLSAYRHFIEGGSSDLVGELTSDPNDITRKLWDGVRRADAMDKVFTPAKEDMTTYKGMSEEMIDYLKDMTGAKSLKSLEGKSFEDKFFSSTSVSKGTAADYAERAYDQDKSPVYIKFNIGKGTPVADARKLLGTEGMRGYEQEITLGRNVKYTIRKVRKSYDSTFDGDRYDVEIDVSPIKKKR